MRLGISSSLTHANPTEWAAKQTALGCKSIVFPVNSDAPEALIAEYERLAHENDLLIAEVGIWRNAVAQEEAQRKANVEYSINQLKLADRLKANCCVNVAGAFGPVWEGGYKENFSQKAWDATVRMIQEVIDEAKPRHTYFTIEPMPWMFPSGPDEYLKLLEAVKRDRFAVHMDLVNMTTSPRRYFFLDEFVDECFDKLGEHIKSCHIKDIHLHPRYTFQLQECMLGKGELPAKHYLERIEALNPEMPVILEHLNTDEEYYEGFEYLKGVAYGKNI